MKPHLGGKSRQRRQAAPRRRPTGPGDRGYQRPGAAAKRPRPRPSNVDSGFSPMTVLLLVVAIGLCVVMGMVLKPANLGKINGYPAELITSETRNLVAEVQTALNPKLVDQKLTFSEAEVNQYLNQRIKGKQGGILAAFVKFEGVYIDFETDVAEIYIVRSVFGLPFSVSSRIAQKRAEYKTIWKTSGGTIGGFSLKTKQFKPILEAFMRLSATCKDEMDAINAIDDTGTVEFGDDQIVLSK